MDRIVFDKEYFNILDTLLCGQFFRYIPYKNGYKVISKDKCCYCYEDGDKSIVECESKDKDYFYNFFDLNRDYGEIIKNAKGHNKTLDKASTLGKGVRILNQDSAEALFWFIISQNNNIPRIKLIIERLCFSLGEKKDFYGEYYAFPKISEMAKKDLDFYSSVGLGYRAEYIKRLAKDLDSGVIKIEEFNGLTTKELKSRLLKIYGVGPKVADCVSLFGFHRSDSFPVDTWIEKVYREDFNGKLKDRNKISEWFTDKFKDNSGYFQQYLFYYKRTLEK